MVSQDFSRRSLLKGGGAAFAGLTVLQVAGPAPAFAQAGEEVVPWLDQPAPNPVPPDGSAPAADLGGARHVAHGA